MLGVLVRATVTARNPAQNFSLCYLHHLGRSYWELLTSTAFSQGLSAKTRPAS